MGKDVLVSSDLAAGRQVIRRLEERGVKVDTALWLQDDETGFWRLIIASQDVNKRGPRPVYEDLQVILAQMKDSGIQLDNINVLTPADGLVKDLKRVVGTNEGLHELRLDYLAIGGLTFRSARIYRVAGGVIENNARVRIRDIDRYGTVRGAIDAPGGRRFRVLYDLTPEDLRPLGAERRPPIGQDFAAKDLELLYVVRTGGWPEKLPEVSPPENGAAAGSSRAF